MKQKGTGHFWYVKIATSDAQVWLEELGDDPEKFGRFMTAFFKTALTGELIEVDKDIRFAYKIAAKGVIGAKDAYLAQCEAGKVNGALGVEKSLETRREKKAEGLEQGRPTSFADFKTCAGYLQDGMREWDMPPVPDSRLRAYYKELQEAGWTIGQREITCRDELVVAIRARFDPDVEAPEPFYSMVFVPLFEAYAGGRTWKGEELDDGQSTIGEAYYHFLKEDGEELTGVEKRWFADPDLQQEITTKVREFITKNRE